MSFWLMSLCLLAALLTPRVNGGLMRRTMLKRYREVAARGPQHPYHATPAPPEQWFTQYLDHFCKTDNRTWPQRYWVRSDLHADGGPVFLSLNGEDEATPSDLVYGMAWEKYAKRHHALMILLEHRFYGNSLPLGEESMDHLEFLSSEQALADTATFIDAMKKEYNFSNTTRWIVFGASYSANLAAWMRYKYPHHVYGAVASSAPVLAKYDYSEFYDVIKDALTTHSKDCKHAEQKMVKQLEKALQTEEGKKRAKKKFMLSTMPDLNDTAQMADLFVGIAWDVYLEVSEGETGIHSFCDVLTNKTFGSPLDRYYHWIATRQLKDYFLTEEEITYEDTEHGCYYPEWTYQTCTEFGYFQTCASNTSLVGNHVPLEYYVRDCKTCFGQDFSPEFIQQSIDRTNLWYGGKDLEVTRVVFVTGSLDPWHPLGIMETRNPASPAIHIQGGIHCSDIYPDYFTDPPGVTEARKQISDIIGQWLADP